MFQGIVYEKKHAFTTSVPLFVKWRGHVEPTVYVVQCLIVHVNIFSYNFNIFNIVLLYWDKMMTNIHNYLCFQFVIVLMDFKGIPPHWKDVWGNLPTAQQLETVRKDNFALEGYVFFLVQTQVVVQEESGVKIICASRFATLIQIVKQAKFVLKVHVIQDVVRTLVYFCNIDYEQWFKINIHIYNYLIFI